MLIANRIATIRRMAELLESEARTLRLMHTLPPHTDWPAEDSATQADHDNMLQLATAGRRVADDMQRELDHMQTLSGYRLQPEGGY